MVSDKLLEALKPPTYEKINELRIAAEKENALLKAELIKTKHEHSLFDERVKNEVRAQANEIHYSDKAIRENVEYALHLVESQLDAVGNNRAGVEFDRLKTKRDLLIELLTVEEDEE